jgi:hypothetical protein
MGDGHSGPGDQERRGVGRHAFEDQAVDGAGRRHGRRRLARFRLAGLSAIRAELPDKVGVALCVLSSEDQQDDGSCWWKEGGNHDRPCRQLEEAGSFDLGR